MTSTLKVVQPPSIVPMVDSRGLPTTAWIQFFASLVALPPAMEAQTPTGSPWDYTASQPGNLLVKGGTVSVIKITRGRDVLVLGYISGFVPLCRGDVATVTYTVIPSVWFLAFK